MWAHLQTNLLYNLAWTCLFLDDRLRHDCVFPTKIHYAHPKIHMFCVVWYDIMVILYLFFHKKECARAYISHAYVKITLWTSVLFIFVRDEQFFRPFYCTVRCLFVRRSFAIYLLWAVTRMSVVCVCVCVRVYQSDLLNNMC